MPHGDNALIAIKNDQVQAVFADTERRSRRHLAIPVDFGVHRVIVQSKVARTSAQGRDIVHREGIHPFREHNRMRFHIDFRIVHIFKEIICIGRDYRDTGPTVTRTQAKRECAQRPRDNQFLFQKIELHLGPLRRTSPARI